MPDPAKGTFLAHTAAYDLFVGNPDRTRSNYVIVARGGFSSIGLIDFADSTLLREPNLLIPDAKCSTLRWFRTLERLHAIPHGAVSEMLSRLADVPVSSIELILAGLPVGWIDPEKQDGFMEFWQSDLRQQRLAAVGAALTNVSNG